MNIYFRQFKSQNHYTSTDFAWYKTLNDICSFEQQFAKDLL